MEKSKLYSVVLSVVIAFGLWLYVVSNVTETDDMTFNNISVDMVGEAVLAERNLMVTSVSSNTVSLNISGARSDLNKVNSGNITVKVDLSNIYEPGEDIELTYLVAYPSDVANNALTVENKNPGSIYVNVDYRRTVDIPVQIKWTGTRSGDYLYDTENAVLDYSTVTITGPAAVADLIDHAEIEIDLTERVESVSESFRYTLCDAEGNPVDAQQITTSVEEIRLEVQIQRIKEIDLVADIVYGGGATADNTIVKITPETIRVSGGEAVLAELGDTYTICSINLADIEKSTNELKYTIALPEGVINQTGVTEVTVSVRFSGLKTKELTIDNFEIINVPEGMEAEIINANLTVKVRGTEEEINKLQERHITAVIDFSAAEVGTATYKANIVLDEAFPNVGAMKTYSVSATVQALEE